MKKKVKKMAMGGLPGAVTSGVGKVVSSFPRPGAQPVKGQSPGLGRLLGLVGSRGRPMPVQRLATPSPGYNPPAPPPPPPLSEQKALLAAQNMEKRRLASKIGRQPPPPPPPFVSEQQPKTPDVEQIYNAQKNMSAITKPTISGAPAPNYGSTNMKKGGAVKKMAKGGSVKSSASKRGDGCAQRGKTKGRFI